MAVKISIITVTYNSAKFVGSAVDSVLAQSYDNFEYIVVDGASTDHTVASVLSNVDQFKGRLSVTSEPDRGIYDAMNKGISLASGDVVGFLNSDDLFASPNVLTMVANAFSEGGKDIVYGDINYVNQADISKVVRYWRSGQVPRFGMRYGWHPPHPAFYVRREKLIEAGGFDLRYNISADYEQMVRLIHRYRYTMTYLPEVFVNMRVGGVSNRSVRNVLRANKECYNAWANNGLKASPLLVPCKLAAKLAQHLNRAETFGAT